MQAIEGKIITEKDLLEFYNSLIRFALSLIYRAEFINNTLPDIYGNIQGPKSKNELLKIFLDSQVFKGFASAIQKLGKLGVSAWTDGFRFTQIIQGGVTVETIILEMKTVAEFVLVDGWELFKIKAKVEDTGYSDMTLIFSQVINGKVVYLEVQINSEPNLEAKKKESPKYDERKTILEKILSNNPSCKLSIKNLKAKLNRHLLNSNDLERFLSKNNLRQLDKELLISYGDSFAQSRAIFADTNPIIYSKESGEKIVQRFKKENPDLVKSL